MAVSPRIAIDAMGGDIGPAVMIAGMARARRKDRALSFEVYGDEARTWGESVGRSIADRIEITGETAFCYARDPQPLLHALAGHNNVRYLHRPANLEYLFIKLTGRELRD